MLRLVGLEHEDLVTMDDPDGKARVDEGKSLAERGKRHAKVLEARRQVGRENQMLRESKKTSFLFA